MPDMPHASAGAKKNVMVLGAGFGGLRAAMDIAKGLRRAGLLDHYEVLLVDKTDHHLYTPLLYEAAAGPTNSPHGLHGEVKDICSYDTTALMKGFPIQFLEREVASLDLPNGIVLFKNGESLKTDFLVIALGSETNYFGIQGLRENSLPMKTIGNALAVRKALTDAFARGHEVKVVVGGAGANGCELAAEIRLWANQAEEIRKKAGAPLHVTVQLLEATPAVLPGLDPRAVRIAARRLAKLGVDVMVNGKIVGVSPKDISLDGGKKISYDVFVWTGGIRTPDMVTQLPLSKEPHGKPMVQTSMVCLPASPDLKLFPMVYAVGDAVCFMNQKTGRPLPAVARVAIQEGATAAHNVVEEIKKAERPGYAPRLRTYKPVEYPYVIPMGEGWAVAKIGPFVFSGWPAIFFKKLIELNYLSSVMPLATALKVWME